MLSRSLLPSLLLRIRGRRCLGAGASVAVLLATGVACSIGPTVVPAPAGAPVSGPAPVSGQGGISEETWAWADQILAREGPRPLATLAPPPEIDRPQLEPPVVPALETDAPAPPGALSLLAPMPSVAREVRPAPPQTRLPWVVATRPSALFRSSTSNVEVVALAPVGTFYRVESNLQDGRYYVRAGLDGELGWIPAHTVAGWPEPSEADIRARVGQPNPRYYLYQRWPSAARRMDCVIAFESGWNASARNPKSDAAGLAQFIASTWARTPYGRAGFSPYDPYAAIDAFGWMVVQGGGSWGEWEVVQVGLC